MTSGNFRRQLSALFSLQADKASDQEIERRIKDAVELKGATPWILMFAIFVASIGLNVNSAAVIIGAMLISPLMGPIMGIGHGLAVYDFALVKKSFRNLGISAAISLLVSTLYFLVSPLTGVQSELLARTSPTLWDVLIALFGGLAGIVGTTREERSNVVPGVAIATALMPPLCTSGYGLATGQWAYFGGAFYLFSINCVFIAVATIIGIRLMHFPRHTFIDSGKERRIRVWLTLIALMTALPAAYLGAQLVSDEVFRSRANGFVQREFDLPNTHVAATSIDPARHLIEVSLIGDAVDHAKLDQINARLSSAGLEQAKIQVYQASEKGTVDLAALKSSLLGDLYRNSQESLRKKDQELSQLRGELAERNTILNMTDDIAAELRVQMPEIGAVTVSQGYRSSGAGEKQATLQLIVTASKPLSARERDKLRAWFRIRTKNEHAAVFVESAESLPPPGKTRRR